MSAAVIVILSLLALAAAIAGIVRLLLARSRRRRQRRVVVDDAAIARILSYGVLTTDETDPLDEDEISRAEAEFWEESWDEPEEFGR